ncbi:uncharacterized protein LAESUDRAFT_763866 [Laetiporus sulphureus 93-53]|uniref:Uncharacterized protein n=1 Tax=Laetiporus sulphureus 93-53 TaxID=1314785 RepID=A0A165BLC6_9APHY|nr:uncharacterized protein LAESUDRAFT_763866 [Laetiporus sulphureus 93-53]KZT01264.1 hypothetical protein LAESUDRAFT_763866 [Laetiporus sulphureus 93-53]
MSVFSSEEVTNVDILCMPTAQKADKRVKKIQCFLEEPQKLNRLNEKEFNRFACKVAHFFVWEGGLLEGLGKGAVVKVSGHVQHGCNEEQKLGAAYKGRELILEVLMLFEGFSKGTGKAGKGKAEFGVQKGYHLEIMYEDEKCDAVMMNGAAEFSLQVNGLLLYSIMDQ